MKYKKLNKIILLSMMLVSLNSINIIAEEKINIDINIDAGDAKTDSDILPYAEVTGYKYMEIDGVKYRRLWSYTRNCWIDEKWNPCP